MQQLTAVSMQDDLTIVHADQMYWYDAEAFVSSSQSRQHCTFCTSGLEADTSHAHQRLCFTGSCNMCVQTVHTHTHTHRQDHRHGSDLFLEPLQHNVTSSFNTAFSLGCRYGQNPELWLKMHQQKHGAYRGTIEAVT